MAKKDDLDKAARDILASLTGKEKKVLFDRFGIEVKDADSIDEVKKKFDITREQISELEESALRKLAWRTQNNDPPDNTE